MPLQVRELVVYPVKSLPGIRVDQAVLGEEGLQYDRRWMLVDKNDNFISLRTEPILYKVKQQINEVRGLITFDSPIGTSSLDLDVGCELPLAPSAIWSDKPEVIHLGTSDFFSELLGKKTGICYMPPKRRKRFTERKNRSFYVGFADAYPVLVLSLESVQQLYGSSDEAFWIRFRPNILLSGCEPFQEDEMRLIYGAEVQLEMVNQCIRCNVPPINPVTLAIDKSIAKVLGSSRRTEAGVVLGMNTLVNKSGIIKRGELLYAE